MAHSHSHDGSSHSHAGGAHGHTHEIMDGPGSYLKREMPIVEGRDFRERAFTVGIGGYAQHDLPWQLERLANILLRDRPDPSAQAKPP